MPSVEDRLRYWQARARAAEGENIRLREAIPLMRLAHSSMRACGWHLAQAADPQGDGILEAAVTEIEGAFAQFLAEQEPCREPT